VVIFVVMPLAHEVYIFKKTSPGAERWAKETAEACALELLNRNRPKKRKTMGAAS